MSKTNPNSYYDIEFEVEEVLFRNGLVEDIFYLKDLKQRKLFIAANISQETVEDAVRHIMQFNREDADITAEERKPIILYVSSNGGDVDAGFELIDVIMNSKTPVYTINLGYQYSMGFLIGLAGHKRYAMPNAKFLLHDGSNFVFDSGAKAQDRMEFNKKMESRIKDYILSRSKLTTEEYDSKYRIEWYMFSGEAKEKGFVDVVIGVDCGLDEIV